MVKKENNQDFILKKLPMWGWKASGDNINFEWPEKSLLDQMSSAVYLKSLDLKAQSNGVLVSIRCNLSNGVSSSIFEKEGIDEVFNYVNHPETIEFDQTRPIRRVKAKNHGNYFNEFRFYDENGDEAVSYNPANHNYTNSLTCYEIGEKEELIGVYGVKG